MPTQFAKEAPNREEPGALSVFPMSHLDDSLAKPFKQIALGYPALMRFRLDKEELSTSTVASLGVPMVEASERRHIRAKLSGRGFEYAAMIHAEQESEGMEMGRAVLLEVS